MDNSAGTAQARQGQDHPPRATQPASFNLPRLSSLKFDERRNVHLIQNHDGVMSRWEPTYAETVGKFMQEEGSDVTIKAKLITLPAHASILYYRSLYFRGALGNNFKESETRVFEFLDMDSLALAETMYFIYGGTYRVCEPEFHLKMLEMGDYFGIPDLKPYVIKRYIAAGPEDFRSQAFRDGVDKIFHGEKFLKGLRDAVVEVLVQNKQAVLLHQPTMKWLQQEENIDILAALLGRMQ